MDIKQELKSWIELSSSYGYELLSDGNNAWRLTFANDLSMQIRIFREPDEMILCLYTAQHPIFTLGKSDSSAIALAALKYAL